MKEVRIPTEEVVMSHPRAKKKPRPITIRSAFSKPEAKAVLSTYLKVTNDEQLAQDAAHLLERTARPVTIQALASAVADLFDHLEQRHPGRPHPYVQELLEKLGYAFPRYVNHVQFATLVTSLRGIPWASEEEIGLEEVAGSIPPPPT